MKRFASSNAKNNQSAKRNESGAPLPTKENTIELFRLAVESESAEIFSQTAENVIQVWRTGKLKSLTANDLAQLAESHLWLLPQEERTLGAVFWLKQEIADLRRKAIESGESEFG